MERDRHSSMRVAPISQTAVFTGTVNGTSIDMEDVDPTNKDAGIVAESLEYVAHVGAIALAGGAASLNPQDSDDDITFADVPADQILGTKPVIPIAAVNAVYRVGVISKKRYQRCQLVEDATSTAGAIGVIAILQDMRHNAQGEQAS